MKIKKQVLVAENDPTARIALVMLLQEMGITVFDTNNGNDALEILRTHVIDLIMVNLQLPQLNAVELIVQAKKISGTAEIIILSEIVNNAVYERMRNMGVFRLVALPLKIEEIKDAVLRGLSSARADRLQAERPLDLSYVQDFIRILVVHTDISVFQKVLEIGLSAGWNVDYAENKAKFTKIIAAGMYDVIVIADALLNTLDKNDVEPVFKSSCKPIVLTISDSPKKTGGINIAPPSQTLYLPAAFTKTAFLDSLKSVLPGYLQNREHSSFGTVSGSYNRQQVKPQTHSIRSLRRKMFSPIVILYCMMIILAGMVGFWISNGLEKKQQDLDIINQTDMMHKMQQYEELRKMYEKKGK